jgi:tRNA(Ser,Leu) C12 N-acetylase TAN1
MNYKKKTWLTPVDPYYTIEIDFSGDIDEIKEQIEELRNQYEKRVSSNEEADHPTKEADTDTSK